MASTEAQKRASAKYNKLHTTRFPLTFGVNDQDILAWLRYQPSQAGYIKALIRADMQSNGKEFSAGFSPEEQTRK